MNIIIPAAGSGRRFTEDGYTYPKPLINVLGEALIVHVIRNLRVGQYDHIHIVYTQELDRYSFRHILKKEFPDLDLNFIPLTFATRGPMETVLCGLNQMTDLDNMVLVMDCDTFYHEDIVRQAKCERENCVFYFTDPGTDPIYSYIKVDGRRVSEIREKERISSFACSGAYGFKSGRLLKSYCELVLNMDQKAANGEYYISNVYDQMIKHGEIVIPCPVREFHCLGTPQQLKTYCMNGEAEKKRFCFDLDGTLVTFPEQAGNYKTVQPITKNIKLVRYLHARGHTIIIQTARRMLSSQYNAGRAAKLAYEDVFGTLEKFEIPFDEIYFGKPHAHFYIDDLTASPVDLERAIGFYDGEIPPRHFNSIEYGAGYVTKTTNNPGEIHWYRNIPGEVREHFPIVYEIDGRQIRMERIQGIVFSYLLINNSLTDGNILNLLNTIARVHASQPVPDMDIDYCANYTPKIHGRFRSFDYGTIAADAAEYLEKITQGLIPHVPMAGVIHGDLVFSNIFLCNHQTIRFIDMRGKVEETETIFGDIFYDYAKIYQSLYGYDFILNDREINETYLKELREFFEVYFVDHFSAEKLETLKYITASLLFSLIPLHEDCVKQKKYFELLKRCL